MVIVITKIPIGTLFLVIYMSIRAIHLMQLLEN